VSIDPVGGTTDVHVHKWLGLLAWDT